MKRLKSGSDLKENERENIFSESVLWRFQSAFVGPFLEVKAKIVDRATIIRQTGLEATQGKSPQEIDRMAIEMNALNKYADIYVEILLPGILNQAPAIFSRRMPGTSRAERWSAM